MGSTGGASSPRSLKSRGVEHLFTLSGGHLFSIYDGCKEEGIGIVDVRHEQTAAFAAEGFAKATRGLGVAALTAGPGVTNGISAIAGAQANGSPICVLGGRAPEMRWGSGSLQEIDHLPFVSPLVKSAETVKEPGADRGDDRGGARPRRWRRRAARPSSTTRSTSSSARPRSRSRRAGGGRGRAGGGGRGGGGAAGRRRAAGDHGRHRPLLGPRRGGAAGAGRGARHPGLPQRPRPRLPARRPRARLQPRPRRPRCRAPTWPWWSACRWTSGSASAAASARRRSSSASTSRRTR